MPSILELSQASHNDADGVRRVALDGAIIGRSAEVDVPVADSSASRQHARLHRRGEEFELENLSPNGTKVNGKSVDRRVLREGDVIEIGATTRLRVRYLSQTGAVIGHGDAETLAGGAFDENQTANPAPGPVRKASLLRRPKVIIGLTIYFVGLLAFMLMLETRKTDIGPPAGWSRERISEQMQSYFAEDSRAFVRTPDARKESAALDRAREAFNTAPVSAKSLWSAAYGFREALAYSPSRAWRGPEDVRRFRQVRDQLIERLCNEYIDALAEHRKGRLKDARQRFNRLQEIVRDRHCELNQHVGRWLAAINAQLD